MSRESEFILNFANKVGITQSEIENYYPDEEFNRRLNKKLANEILSGRLPENWVDLRELGENLKQHMDRRTPLEYLIGLIHGWIIEDIVIHFLKGQDLTPTKNGADADRQFLDESMITSSSDITINGYHFDISYDSKDYWKRDEQGGNDIRLNKWNSVKAVNGFLIIITNDGIVLVDSNKEEDKVPYHHKFFGDKLAIKVGGFVDRLQDPLTFADGLKQKFGK